MNNSNSNGLKLEQISLESFITSLDDELAMEFQGGSGYTATPGCPIVVISYASDNCSQGSCATRTSFGVTCQTNGSLGC